MTKVQKFREEQKLSKRELARRARITDSTVRRLENGDEQYKGIALAKFYAIAKALGKDLIDIIDFDLLD